MRNIATTALLFCAVVLNACSLESDVTYQVTVESSELATIETTDQILLARFHRVLPSFFSTVNSEVSGSIISYTFRRGAPDESMTTYLCRTIGTFSISLADDDSEEIWVTELDIERAEAGLDESGPFILIQLSEAAGERMLFLTSQNLGKVLTGKMGSETLFEATIRGQFASRFQVRAPLGADAKAIAAILESGSLPALVTLRDSKDAA